MLGTSTSTSHAQGPPPGFTIQSTSEDKKYTATFALSGIPSKPTNLPASAELTVGGKGNPNQAFQTWWWYRLPGDTRESAINAMNPVWSIPKPPGNKVASANFNLGAGLASTMDWGIETRGDARGLLESDLKVTNNGKAPVDLTIFHYLDLDLGGTGGDDQATWAPLQNGQPRIFIKDPNWQATYSGDLMGFTHYDSDAFPKVRDLLTNNAKDDFPDIKNYFLLKDGDWTGGFEWTRTIQPGDNTNFDIQVALGPLPMPEPTTFWLFLVGMAGPVLLVRLREKKEKKKRTGNAPLTNPARSSSL
jgi:hypothetical protein